jgi:hypothetical protein
MNQLQQPVEASNLEPRTPNAEHRRAADVLAWVKHFFDYLSASREEPPPGAAFLASPIWLGIWWGLMIGLILLFCGQTSKFIYIDF